MFIFSARAFQQTLIFSWALALVGCQTAPYAGVMHEVSVVPKVRGVIALPHQPRAEDRALAEQRMVSVCAPNHYRTISEKETNVQSADEVNRPDEKSKVVPKTEWDISYECTTP